VAWHPGVVFIDFAEACFPVVELARRDADPGQEARRGDRGLAAPGADEIDELIAGIVRDTAAGQSSPRLFFSSVCASMSSAMTSFSFWSLASSCWMRASCTVSTVLGLRPLRPLAKARCPFSKNFLSQS